MRIGQVEIGGVAGRPLALAPMDDISDMPFRLLCKRHGADLVFTEFVQTSLLVSGGERPRKRLEISEKERPIGIQIYGSDEEGIRAALPLVEEAEPDFIDINCGCWVKKIAMRGDGAGLLRDLVRFESVVRTVVEGTGLPVTVKTRLGWDEGSIVILDVARMVEQCGVCALTVHCRTRKQGYSGEADWRWLERIRGACRIPLIGNGDVTTAEGCKRMLELGCDGVMIGRGAICSPWVFAHFKHYLETGVLLLRPGPGERLACCREHLTSSCAYKGERRGVREFRKLYRGYLGDLPGFGELRADLMELGDLAPLLARLDRFGDGLPEEPGRAP